jgi:hypothetical protein
LIPHGTTAYKTVEEASAAAREAMQMRKLGHAVVVYETYDHDNKFLSAFATHYRTCQACRNPREAGESDGFKVG